MNPIGWDFPVICLHLDTMNRLGPKCPTLEARGMSRWLGRDHTLRTEDLNRLGIPKNPMKRYGEQQWWLVTPW